MDKMTFVASIRARRKGVQPSGDSSFPLDFFFFFLLPLSWKRAKKSSCYFSVAQGAAGYPLWRVEGLLGPASLHSLVLW